MELDGKIKVYRVYKMCKNRQTAWKFFNIWFQLEIHNKR